MSYHKDTNTTKIRINLTVKRVFIFLSIIIILLNPIYSQDLKFSDPYSEKILLNPAYSGISNCYEINLIYNKNFIQDQFAFTGNNYYEKFKSGLGFLITDKREGKGAINNFSFGAIYSYKVNITERSIINTAIQANYIQQSINSQKLVFSDQVDPFSGTVNNSSSEVTFMPYNNYDFSAGITYISYKMRFGAAIHHIDKIFRTENQLKPKYTIHFGKVFSVTRNTDENKLYLVPEIIYISKDDVHQIFYSIHLNNDIFISRFYLKHNLGLNVLSSVFSIGLNYKNIRLSYTYEIMFTKYILLPVSSNQLSLKFNLFCKEKRIKKNTIYCSNF